MIFFFCIRRVSAHNFADDNTVSSFPRSVKLLLKILIARSENAIKWFSDNKMVDNPDKFKSIIIQKNKPKQFLIGNDVAEVASSVNLLGIHIDNQLNFNLHMINSDALRELVPFVQIENRKKHPLRKLLLVLQATVLRGCFSRFLNCTNDTKSRNASQFM